MGILGGLCPVASHVCPGLTQHPVSQSAEFCLCSSLQGRKPASMSLTSPGPPVPRALGFQLAVCAPALFPLPHRAAGPYLTPQVASHRQGGQTSHTRGLRSYRKGLGEAELMYRERFTDMRAHAPIRSPQFGEPFPLSFPTPHKLR